jgi:hypothetical protein
MGRKGSDGRRIVSEFQMPGRVVRETVNYLESLSLSELIGDVAMVRERILRGEDLSLMCVPSFGGGRVEYTMRASNYLPFAEKEFQRRVVGL